MDEVVLQLLVLAKKARNKTGAYSTSRKEPGAAARLLFEIH